MTPGAEVTSLLLSLALARWRGASWASSSSPMLALPCSSADITRKSCARRTSARRRALPERGRDAFGRGLGAGEGDDVVGRHRAGEAFQGEVGQLLDLGQVLDRDADALADQDLAVA